MSIYGYNVTAVLCQSDCVHKIFIAITLYLFHHDPCSIIMHNYGNPNVTKLSKFKLKGTKVQSCIWKGAKGQTCKLKGVKVQSYIWQGAKGQTCKFKELINTVFLTLYFIIMLNVPSTAFEFAGLTFCTLPCAKFVLLYP